jgi:hypothetical protein
MPRELGCLVDALLRAGFRVELRSVHTASYHAVIFNGFKQEVGDIEYRSAEDEPHGWAQGLSYAGYVRALDPITYLVTAAAHGLLDAGG